MTKRWGRTYEAFTFLEGVESGRCHCFWMKQNSELYTMMWSKFKITLFYCHPIIMVVFLE